MKLLKVIPFLILPLLVLLSCKSLPLPGSPTESLFIFVADLDRSIPDKYSKSYYLQSVEITLKNIDSGEEQSFNYSPSTPYYAVPLEPGRYETGRQITLSFKNTDGWEWKDVYPIRNAVFLIEKNVIYVSPMVLRVKGRSGSGGYRISQKGLNDEILKDEAMEKIMGKRRFSAWNLSPIIGWTPPETEKSPQ
jgi:hypothetical protein